MKLNQEGNVSILAAVIIILVVIIGIGIVSKQQDHKRAFNAWVGKCVEKKGIVAFSGTNSADCFVDSKPCRITGFEKYESLNSNPIFNNLPNC